MEYYQKYLKYKGKYLELKYGRGKEKCRNGVRCNLKNDEKHLEKVDSLSHQYCPREKLCDIHRKHRECLSTGNKDEECREFEKLLGITEATKKSPEMYYKKDDKYMICECDLDHDTSQCIYDHYYKNEIKKKVEEARRKKLIFSLTEKMVVTRHIFDTNIFEIPLMLIIIDLENLSDEDKANKYFKLFINIVNENEKYINRSDVLGININRFIKEIKDLRHSNGYDIMYSIFFKHLEFLLGYFECKDIEFKFINIDKQIDILDKLLRLKRDHNNIKMIMDNKIMDNIEDLDKIETIMGDNIKKVETIYNLIKSVSRIYCYYMNKIEEDKYDEYINNVESLINIISKKKVYEYRDIIKKIIIEYKFKEELNKIRALPDYDEKSDYHPKNPNYLQVSSALKNMISNQLDGIKDVKTEVKNIISLLPIKMRECEKIFDEFEERRNSKIKLWQSYFDQLKSLREELKEQYEKILEEETEGKRKKQQELNDKKILEKQKKEKESREQREWELTYAKIKKEDEMKKQKEKDLINITNLITRGNSFGITEEECKKIYNQLKSILSDPTKHEVFLKKIKNMISKDNKSLEGAIEYIKIQNRIIY